jgi:drug/metabolite transporter (DMT)-like permease
VSAPLLSPLAADDIRRGVLWVILSTALVTAQDGLGKHLVQSYPLLQVLWARFVVHALVVALMCGRAFPAAVASRRLGLQLARSASLLLATVFFLGSLLTLPLADAMALIFLTPILATVLSIPLLKEKVGVRRWLGVLAGFAGALVIVRPGVGVMDEGAVLALSAAVVGAVFHLLTRRLGTSEPPISTFVYTPAVGVAALSVAVPFLWVAPGFDDALLMLLMGLFAGFGHSAFIKAFQYAPVAVVSPLTYLNLFWATLLGYSVFGDLPDRWTLAGAAIIAAAGLYIFHRERRRLHATAGGPR